uniref:Uncharacterized protein n=1 Tax=Octopus bimaculoides TaxID=37653 RepID=A0A0L8GJ19_OCTBM
MNPYVFMSVYVKHFLHEIHILVKHKENNYDTKRIQKMTRHQKQTTAITTKSTTTRYTFCVYSLR